MFRLPPTYTLFPATERCRSAFVRPLALAAERRYVSRTAVAMRSERDAFQRTLEKLQHGRSRHSLVRDTLLDDLESRLVDAAMWCARNGDLAAAATSLRPARFAPPPLSPHRWDTIGDVARMPRRDLHGERAG